MSARFCVRMFDSVMTDEFFWIFKAGRSECSSKCVCVCPCLRSDRGVKYLMSHLRFVHLFFFAVAVIDSQLEQEEDKELLVS